MLNHFELIDSIDIKSAVEWLKEQLTNEDRKISEFMTQDIYYELSKIIDEAFADVTDKE